MSLIFHFPDHCQETNANIIDKDTDKICQANVKDVVLAFY